MRALLEVSFRGVEKTEAVDALIREKAAKLEKICSDLISCRVAVERPQQHQRSGSPFRVRISLGVPSGHEVVVRRESGEGELHENLSKVLRKAFDVARRRLQEVVERRRDETKTHEEQKRVAFVVRLFPEEDYGFLKTPDGRELYFHRNSVLHDDFDRLETGTGVRFSEEMGEKGPQATTVQIVDKPGSRAPKSNLASSAVPRGWEGEG